MKARLLILQFFICLVVCVGINSRVFSEAAVPAVEDVSDWQLSSLSVVGLPYIFAYDRISGRAELIVINAQKSSAERTWEGNLKKGFTHLMAFGSAKKPMVLTYDSDTGNVSKLKVAADGSQVEIIEDLAWSQGWSNLQAFQYDGKNYYITYNRQSGYTKINEIKKSGKVFSTVYDKQWKTGRTTLIPVSDKNSAHFFLYNALEGKVTVSELTGSNNSMDAAGKWWAQWSKESSRFSSFMHNDQCLIARYKEKSKVLQLLKFSPNEGSVSNLSSVNVDLTKNAFTVLDITGHLFLVEKNSRFSKISEFNGDLDRFTKVWHVES